MINTMQDSIKEIMNAVEKTLNDEIKIDGGKLSDVKTLVIGDRTATAPKTPAIWVQWGTCNLVPNDQYLRTEMWAMEINLLSVIYNTNAQKGFEEANDLALRAKSVILFDRTLGFGNGTYFSDVRSLRFEGNNPNLNNGNLYSAIYTFEVYFTVIERSE